MGKEFAAHIQGLAIGLASGAAVITNFGPKSMYVVGFVSIGIATIAYALEKRSDARAE